MRPWLPAMTAAAARGVVGAGSGDEEKRVEDGELCLGLRDASLLGPSSPVREDDANAAEAGEGGVEGLGVM